MEPASVKREKSKVKLTRQFLLNWLSDYAVDPTNDDRIVDFVIVYLYPYYEEAKLNLLQDEKKSTLIELLTKELKNSDLRAFYRNKYQQLDKFALALSVLRLDREGNNQIQAFMDEYERRGDLNFANIYLKYVNTLSQEGLRELAVALLVRDGKLRSPSRGETYEDVMFDSPGISDKELLEAMQSLP